MKKIKVGKLKVKKTKLKTNTNTKNTNKPKKKTKTIILSSLLILGIAVDTHVTRVSFRLGLTKSGDVSIIEQDLMKYFPKNKWSRVHHQLVLFGRYICKSKNPDCNNCPFYKCKYLKNIDNK